MAKFYDGEVYELTHVLTGDEVFIIYQDEVSKTVDTDVFATDLALPLISNLYLNDLVNVTYFDYSIILDSYGEPILDSYDEPILDTSILGLDNIILADDSEYIEDDDDDPILDDQNVGSSTILIYNNELWIKSINSLGGLGEIGDVTITSPQVGQVILWSGTGWENGNDPVLMNYTETEYNAGSVSGTHIIDLVDGNIQRLTVNGELDVTLPELPPTGQHWSLTLKVVSDGVNLPSFVSPDGTLKWSWGIEPMNVGEVGVVNMYVFVSDTIRSEVYGTMVSNYFDPMLVPTSLSLLYTLDNPNPYGTSTDDNFARAVAVSPEYSIVGAIGEGEVGAFDSGKSYIFDNTTGNLLHTLNNPNDYGNPEFDMFGYDVAIYGSKCLVSANGEDKLGQSNSGVAYIFDNTTGSLLHTLYNPTELQSFGNKLGMCQNYCILSVTFSSSVYLYDVNTGNLLHTLNNPNDYGNPDLDSFGGQVAICDTYSAVSATRTDIVGSEKSGKAYIYNNVTGGLTHTLENPNAYGTPENDEFGYSIDISEKYCVVSSFQEDDETNINAGKAYIFDNITGNLLHTLDNPNPYGTSGGSKNGDRYGLRVAINDYWCVVSAPAEEISAEYRDSGFVYIFDNVTGELIHTLENPNAYGSPISDNFGYSLGICDTHVIVGLPYEDDEDGVSSGKAYVYLIE